MALRVWQIMKGRENGEELLDTKDFFLFTRRGGGKTQVREQRLSALLLYIYSIFFLSRPAIRFDLHGLMWRSFVFTHYVSDTTSRRGEMQRGRKNSLARCLPFWCIYVYSK